MYRKISEVLKKWKESNTENPLMVIGARQIGKTYIITEFCKNNYDNFLYFNLERDVEIASIFNDTINPEEIIEQISLIKKVEIDVDNTIIFFDEIQESERAVMSLKYFKESSLNYKIICAGSLLGVKLNRFYSSFPVGCVDIKYMYPMDFEEFMIACGNELLVSKIKECYKNNKVLSNILHEQCLELFNHYLVVGGMPKMVESYINGDFKLSNVNFDIQEGIIFSYKADMNKYTEYTESIKNNKIYDSMPSQLARENTKFNYSLVDDGARKERYKSSIQWLVASGLVLNCSRAEKCESPLVAYTENGDFKLYLSDCGLLRQLSKIDYNEVILGNNIMYRGALTENYVAQQLFPRSRELYYFRFDNYEIDFLIKINGNIIPIEVKSGKRTSSASFNNYLEKYKPEYGIRISTKNFGFENNIKSVPLYAVFCVGNVEDANE